MALPLLHCPHQGIVPSHFLHFLNNVPDPEAHPYDPYVFGPPGSGSIIYLLCYLFDFLSLKSGVNVP